MSLVDLVDRVTLDDFQRGLLAIARAVPLDRWVPRDKDDRPPYCADIGDIRITIWRCDWEMVFTKGNDKQVSFRSFRVWQLVKAVENYRRDLVRQSFVGVLDVPTCNLPRVPGQNQP